MMESVSKCFNRWMHFNVLPVSASCALHKIIRIKVSLNHDTVLARSVDITAFCTYCLEYDEPSLHWTLSPNQAFSFHITVSTVEAHLICLHRPEVYMTQVLWIHRSNNSLGQGQLLFHRQNSFLITSLGKVRTALDRTFLWIRSVHKKERHRAVPVPH